MWPSVSELEELNLSEPLRLKAVRTKGVLNHELTAIQLVFNNGVETEWMDSKRADAGEDYSTVELPDKPIKKIKAYARLDGYIRKLSFELEDGKDITAYYRNAGLANN